MFRIPQEELFAGGIFDSPDLVVYTVIGYIFWGENITGFIL